MSALKRALRTQVRHRAVSETQKSTSLVRLSLTAAIWALAGRAFPSLITKGSVPRRSKAIKSAHKYVSGQMQSNYCLIVSWGPSDEYTAMRTTGTVFQPELIELMRAVLDDTTAMLPESKRTSSMKAEIASHILASAANGERDPKTLKATALSAVVECTHYSHDIGPARREV